MLIHLLFLSISSSVSIHYYTLITYRKISSIFLLFVYKQALRISVDYMIGIFVIGFLSMTTIVTARTFDEPNILITSTLLPVEKAAVDVPPPPQPPPAQPQQPNGTCFYAEPELCQEHFNESEPCKECMPHPVYSNSLVCVLISNSTKACSFFL